MMFQTLNATIVGVKELSTLAFLKAAALKTRKHYVFKKKEIGVVVVVVYHNNVPQSLQIIHPVLYNVSSFQWGREFELQGT